MKTHPTSDISSILVTIDSQEQAVYVTLREGLKSARTEVKNEWPLLTVDYARDGRVIGVESVGVAKFSLKLLLKEAGVRVPARALRDPVFSTTAAA